MSISRELAEKALGSLALKLITDIYTSEQFSFITDGLAIRALQDIQDVLNQEELTDFVCIEKIVSIFENYGLSCDRHDFG